MRCLLSLLVACLLAGPATAQIVPVWRVITDVTGSICPLIKDGDVDGAVHAAQALGYWIDDHAKPSAEIAGSGHFVGLRGRHFDTLILSASDGVAWCATTLRQSTPQSVAEAADPHLAALGYSRVHEPDDRQVGWSGETGQASAFRVLKPEPATTLAIRFTYMTTSETDQ